MREPSAGLGSWYRYRPAPLHAGASQMQPSTSSFDEFQILAYIEGQKKAGVRRWWEPVKFFWRPSTKWDRNNPLFPNHEKSRSAKVLS